MLSALIVFKQIPGIDGHYTTTFSKSPFQTQWFHADDSKVARESLAFVKLDLSGTVV